MDSICASVVYQHESVHTVSITAGMNGNVHHASITFMRMQQIISFLFIFIVHTRRLSHSVHHLPLFFFLMPLNVQGGKFVGVKADNTEVQLATILVAPTLAWNAVPVNNAASLGEVVSVKFEAADGSYGNIAEIKLYRSC